MLLPLACIKTSRLIHYLPAFSRMSRVATRLVRLKTGNIIYYIHAKTRNRCGRLTPRRFVSETSCILIYTCVNVLLPRLASRSSCVNYTKQMWLRYSRRLASIPWSNVDGNVMFFREVYFCVSFCFYLAAFLLLHEKQRK